MFSWPWSIALFLPMALLLFPDGHLPSPRWRYVAWAIVLTAPLFVLEMVTGTETGLGGNAPGLSRVRHRPPRLALDHLRDAHDVAPWWSRWSHSSSATGAAVRPSARQLLWLLMAGLIVVAAVAPWAFVAGTPIAVLFAIPLVPLAIAVAVVRHQLLDIRLVVSRALAWLLLSSLRWSPTWQS